jgi:hypothetical protein
MITIDSKMIRPFARHASHRETPSGALVGGIDLPPQPMVSFRSTRSPAGRATFSGKRIFLRPAWMACDDP